MSYTYPTLTDGEPASKPQRHRGPNKPLPTPTRLDDESFVRLHQIVDVGVPLSTSHILRLVREGTFPAPYRIGRVATAWKVGEVRQWMRSRQKAA